MLLDTKMIVGRFEENLEWARELDLATAWATEHDGLRLLENYAQQGLKVRTIVGLWKYLTEPEALRRLHRLTDGELRMADGSRRFHPKVYLFRGKGRTSAWVGSANFTAGGFLMNEEAVFETEKTESVNSWFENLWSECEQINENSINEYEQARDENTALRQPLVRAGGITEKPMDLLEAVGDEGWDSYFAALCNCDVWWCNHARWSVLGETISWRHTIEVLHDVLTQQDLANLRDADRRRVLGLAEGGWDLLGNMGKNNLGKKVINTVFKQYPQRIQSILREAAEAKDNAFPDLAFSAHEQMMKLEGVGQGIATRLLSLARPDRFVSVNNGSQDCLARYSSLPRTTLGRNRYQQLLRYIYEQRWFRAPEPDDRFHASIWRMRAALLDCFVYRPPG